MKIYYLLLISILLISILSINFYFIIINKNNNLKNEDFSIQNKPRGICYFDIDDTLTSAIDDTDEIIQECLDNNFSVGIITASNREINHICSGEKSGGLQNATWMSDKLCKQFKKTGGKLFNSLKIIDGKKNFPYDFLNNKSYGYIKGFQMQYGKNNLQNPDDPIPDKCVVLFDDNPDVLNGVKKFNNNLEVKCANKKCGEKYLSKDVVKQKLKKMILNGC